MFFFPKFLVWQAYVLYTRRHCKQILRARIAYSSRYMFKTFSSVAYSNYCTLKKIQTVRSFLRNFQKRFQPEHTRKYLQF